jgi:hypothetical protein
VKPPSARHHGNLIQDNLTNKSFLVLFFKKEQRFLSKNAAKKSVRWGGASLGLVRGQQSHTRGDGA